MAETLGDRILVAADDWADNKPSMPWGPAAAKWDDLCALAARADAAEALALATAALEIPDRLRSPADVPRIAAEFDAALARWREVTGG